MNDWKRVDESYYFMGVKKPAYSEQLQIGVFTLRVYSSGDYWRWQIHWGGQHGMTMNSPFGAKIECPEKAKEIAIKKVEEEISILIKDVKDIPNRQATTVTALAV